MKQPVLDNAKCVIGAGNENCSVATFILTSIIRHPFSRGVIQEDLQLTWKRKVNNHEHKEKEDQAV